MDTWLRNTYDHAVDLPSVEFMLLVRVLVKQVHAFGNAAEIDNTSMAELRKLAQPMLCGNMFNFLKSLILRWPLDGSFQSVLELFLSYIQPWRYTCDRDYSQSGKVAEIAIAPRYETFIQENLRDYTQIFVLLMPRLEQLDLASFRDVMMLYRLIKVFGQSRLAQILRHFEEDFVSSMSPRKVYKSSPVHRANTTTDLFGYVTLFNSPAMDNLMEQLMRRVKIAQYFAAVDRDRSEAEEKRNSSGFINNLKYLFSMADTAVECKALRDKKRIPEILSFILETSGNIFQIDVKNISIDEVIAQTLRDETQSISQNASLSAMHNSSNMISFNGTIPSPAAIRSRVPVYRGDPALLPIQSNEISFLVRFLYQLCLKINVMVSEIKGCELIVFDVFGIVILMLIFVLCFFQFENDFNELWSRRDIVGKLVRPFLAPPMTAETFERCSGYVNLRYDHLGPRVFLRPLASYSTLAMIVVSLILGRFLFQVPSLGLFILMLCYIAKCYIAAALRGGVKEEGVAVGESN